MPAKGLQAIVKWHRSDGQFRARLVAAPFAGIAPGEGGSAAPSDRADRLDVPRPEPVVARALVLAALDELVDAGLGKWSERDDGLVELRLTSGERWLPDGDGVTRLA